MVVVPGGRVCGCGRQGCVEAYASKTAIAAIIREHLSHGRDSYLKKALSKKKSKPLSSNLIEEALKMQDPVTQEVIGEAQSYLGLLTANLVNTLDPDVIVFGGGLVEQLGDTFLNPIRDKARRYYLQQKDADKVRIVPSTLGDYAGTIGAAVVAQRRLDTR
jgi:glucokinase